jgi:hypothetical protein
MLSRKSRVQRRHRLAIESLEGRAVPAAFGVPWSDPSHLTSSFVPDGTPIAGHTSSLFQTLGAVQPSNVWQGEVLRAFQTWAVNANINIGLVSDGGQPLGTAGASQHDPRFGDIRIGAQPMAASALSISVPNDPAVSSTLTGDVLINTADNFSNLDLFSVMLHEAGHVFGIGDSSDPSSPMYSNYQDNTQLTSADIAALQALYGTRAPDPHEGSGGNNTIGTATTIQFPGGYTGTTPLVVYGDISTNKDVDIYAVRPPSGYSGPLTVRLQSAGISLLAPHLSLLDANGNILADAQAASDMGDVVTLHLNQSNPNATYYIKVQGATSDVFGIGSYGVAVTFDATSTVSASAIDSVLRGPYQALSSNDINTLFLGTPNPLFNSGQGGGGNSSGGPTTLVASPGYARNAHYEVVGSLSGPTDAHSYGIQTADAPPNNQPLVLTVTVRALGSNGTAPRVTVINGSGNTPVPLQVLANGNGTFTVQAVGLKGGGWYFLNVGSGVASGSPTSGNYALTAQFGTAAANLSTFAAASNLALGSTVANTLYVGETQLMNFVLSANVVAGTAAQGSAVAMTVRDQLGRVVYALTAAVGDTVSGAALMLTPGAYTITYTALGGSGAGGPPLAFQLQGDSISDPIGPVLTDPTLAPDYQDPGVPGWFLYPDSTITNFDYDFTTVLPADVTTTTDVVAPPTCGATSSSCGPSCSPSPSSTTCGPTTSTCGPTVV